ncbi:ABC transporter substrate-binding protein [Streptomyces sp. NBC_01428]|uniref:ABC transporter substrate-binding protein n=1 Tax=Streptomyces sp. NBC_01428 TaxID=2903861 RepID=UPI002E3200A7|nr:ABC transporter substrate-binding protein [Streptomyces sp. NBC_01428]
MRSVRVRVLAVLLVLAGVGVAGWQLLPKKENTDRTITVGTTDAVTSLDPAGAYDAGSWALFSNLFQSLLTFEPGGAEPVPDAAKSCAFSDSGLRTYRCTLRDDVAFPSGRRMTGEDVKFSFERVKRINSEVGPASLLSTLGTVDASGQTVTFHLSSPDATFPFKVATGAGSIVDHTRYPKRALRTGTDADGTGPYTLKKYAKDQRAVLAPNSRYEGAVKDLGRPVVLSYYPDSQALQAAWKAKKFDVAARQLPPAMLARLSPSDPKQRVTEAASAETRNLVLNVRASSPLHDARVRQAVASLIDREQLVDRTYRGTTEALYGLIPAGITGHSTSFFDAYPKPDAKKARALLTEAGVTLPVRFTYGFAEGRGAAGEEATELKRQLEAGGLFKVTTKGYEWTDFQKRYAEGALDAWAVGWVADYPDPDTFGAPLVGTGNSMKNGYSSKDVDRLIRETQQDKDRSRTTDSFQRIQESVAQDVPLIPLWQRKDYVLSSEDVGGGQYLSDGTGVFRLWRLVWI